MISFPGGQTVEVLDSITWKLLVSIESGEIYYNEQEVNDVLYQ